MIRVLVVDDSPFIRLALKKLLSSERDIEIVGEASNGKEAVRLVQELKPDVVTLDVNMPVMDGLTALVEIRKVCPACRVLMVSSLTQEGARETLQALNSGALDFITKPNDYQELFNFREEIIAKIRAAYEAKVETISGTETGLPEGTAEGRFKIPPVVALGISTGGPQTLNVVLPKLPEDFPSPILIAIHMPDTFTATFARHLDSMCRLPVKEAEEGEVIRGGHVYVSRGRIHMTLSGTPERAFVRYVKDDSYIYKPSADLLLSSAAKVYRENTIGVVMTGMGNDGSKGIVEVKRAGGVTVAEDPKTAILWAMPESAIKTGCVDYVVPKERLPELLLKLTSQVHR
ncbi:two-component system chemotaxis response regulator CheB [Hydrogenivirga caldilitoris]|uniref:Protein-glutamate methylesterase/protein-glutamine glutaminase n=1 Tax=Hydrogenivirga caldilitoris TaxID=246264 RepID=A0A497XSS7_9AQUI|nr:chemotaxis response regulator protein-glutamate methylesterase [Hydrogenivirga caldilitoris]RLJ69973.1 two-component system chemotaxis response regulator CheB [Hydrogenivirga caldilitoris]